MWNTSTSFVEANSKLLENHSAEILTRFVPLPYITYIIYHYSFGQ